MKPQRTAPLVIERTPRASRWDSATQHAAPRGILDAARVLADVASRALAPPRCAGCGWFCEHLFCAACAPKVRRVEDDAPLCQCCGEPESSLDDGFLCSDCRAALDRSGTHLMERSRSLWMLSGPVRHAVHSLKYLRHSELALSLGAHMGAFALQDAVLARASLLVPVPLHPRREWSRGFNQSALLARHAAREMGVPFADILRRVRHTPTQTSLSRSARDANVRAAFEVPAPQCAKYLRGEASGLVLLIDDVWTTGATLRECARSLRKAGFEHVGALTLARRGR